MNVSAESPVVRRIGPLHIVMGCSAAFLLTNKVPVLAIAATAATVALGMTGWLLRGRLKVLAVSAAPLGMLAVIYAYLVGSYLASGQPASALLSYEFLRHDGNFFFAYAMFFAFATPYINYRPLFMFYHTLLLVVFSAFAVMGLFEMAARTPILVSRFHYGDFFFVGLNKAHNATGSVYAAACLVALAAWLFEDKSPARKRRYLAFTVLCIIGLLMTRSRGSVLAFAIAAGFLLYQRYGIGFIRSKTFIVLVLLLVVAVVMTGAQQRWLASVNYDQDYNIMSRFALWTKALELVRMSPVTGIGFGRFNDLPLFLSGSRPHLEGIPGIAAFATTLTPAYDDAHAHNSYLQFLAETGIIGLGLLLGFWYMIFSRCRRAAKDSRDSNVRFASASGMASIVLLLFLSLTENYMSATTVMLFLSASIGTGMGLIGQSSGEGEAGHEQAI